MIVILFVDDDLASHETIDAMLGSDPYLRLHALSALEGLTTLATQSVDLVVCDVMMPDIDGFAMCRMIRANAAWKLIPIILVTALTEPDDMVRGLEVGADEFLSKPVDRFLLRARIRVALRVRAQYLELGRAPSNPEQLQVSRREALIAAAGLSAREHEVLELLLLGRTQVDIALVLQISPRTVKFHQANLLTKLGADARRDLLRLFL